MSTDIPSSTSGQTFNHTLIIDGNIISTPQIQGVATIYPMDRYTFEVLKSTNSNPLAMLIDLLKGSTVALIINLVAKFICNKLDSTIPFDKWELFAFVISLFLLILSIIIAEFIEDDRKSMVSQISNHFKASNNGK